MGVLACGHLPAHVHPAMSDAPLWLFDLDNTLHNTSAHIFPRINVAMTEYMVRHLQISQHEADQLRRQYWLRYGATMLGLMRHHDTDPQHFLHHTHQFPDLPDLVVPEPALRGILRRLPGRKMVVSNGPHDYVCAVLREMGLLRSFEQVFGVEQLALQPKPDPRAFHAVLRRLRVPATRCTLVEDSLENLRSAKALGMRTVWISRSARKPADVDVQLRSVLHIARLQRP